MDFTKAIDFTKLSDFWDAVVSNFTETDTRLKGIEDLSLGDTKNEVIAGRGNRTTLGNRLSQSLDADGDLKFDSLRTSMSVATGDTPTYVDASTFTVPGDRTTAYLAGVLLKFTLGSSTVYAAVSSSSYSTVTTVTLRSAVLTSSLSAVAFQLAVLNREEIEIPAINKLLASTANIVDVMIYDTTKDSDGGAWVERCQHLSWYNEALNTATRGATRKFPRVALIVAETDTVTIYDATEADLDMWMVFEDNVSTHNMMASYSGAPVSSVAMRDGLLCIGSGRDLSRVNFISDRGTSIQASSTQIYKGGIQDRNAAVNFTYFCSDTIVSGVVNDVAITVLPGAPIDAATGLPVPTIAVATEGGLSVIRDTGDVYDIVASVSLITRQVAIDSSEIYMSGYNSEWTYVWDIPDADISTSYFGDACKRRYGNTGYPQIIDGSTDPHICIFEGALVNGCEFGLNIVADEKVDVGGALANANMVTEITTSYNSGWMPGDIRGAFLANSKTADRSYKGNTLTETGTVTEAAAETGAEIKAYSGWSASNYLSQAYDAYFDFSTGDFSICFWGKTSVGSQQYAVRRSTSAGGGARFAMGLDPTTHYFSASTIDSAAVTMSVADTVSGADGLWHHWCTVKRGTTLELWKDGHLVGTDSDGTFGSMDNATALLYVGVTNGPSIPWHGSLALVRLTALAVSEDQIGKMVESEKYLFRDNANCLLGGTSTAVAALGYDPDTDRLAVATSDGTSLFRGLERVDYIDAVADTNLTTDDHNAVGVARGQYLIGSAAEAVVSQPEQNVREGLLTPAAAPEPPLMVFEGFTSDATPTVMWSLPIFEGEDVDLEVHVKAVEDADSPSERASYSKRAAVYRVIGGNVTLDGVDALATDRESTGTMDCTVDVDTTSQQARVKVTGVAATTIKWTGKVRLTGGRKRFAA